MATAIRAHQLGLQAVVVDRRRPPIDKPCGEGLMPDGLLRLRQLGVKLPAQHTGLLAGIRYLDGETIAEARFPDGGGLGVRRLALHSAMVEKARELGVEMRWETRAEGLLPMALAGRDAGAGAAVGVATTNGEIRSRFLVGADGLRSQIRRWSGLEARSDSQAVTSPTSRFGVRRHFALRPWSDHVEVYWADGREAYVTPVGDREIGVAMLWSGSKGGFDQHLEHFPRLADRLRGGEVVSKDRGCGPLQCRVRNVIQGRIALVGDAAGYLDAITGEGLSMAFHQAFALAEAISEGRLASYRRAHRRIGRMPNRMTRGLLFVERRPWLRRRLIRGLAADPGLFARLLGLHARTHSARQLGVVPTLRLAFSLTTG